ncbi:hypothetical protein J3Q64DRAFT_1700490 [Phycomyces blakesleeanus]|uniref:Uncharacterized protein n=2 Tax=Phycomyces blakesleeanus TaxID=4837 RepID=A0A162X6J7_PHYB8|nr:hypothetical protein PHYBLDRAFT_169085 [Phycomyces blakesleeanus NRRL 1555(-)]OAD72825.1 hypothetical protein PHYBLDRAFT_169085 [Phycomyces blakesleeanus NRRL 1555(-)]|eukprot:XP_018290865.1 hypothetical protein PHYBLDRAFT_169085 [Phycomyces blakesleeanus NRRL 1555(-)]
MAYILAVRNYAAFLGTFIHLLSVYFNQLFCCTSDAMLIKSHRASGFDRIKINKNISSKHSKNWQLFQSQLLQNMQSKNLWFKALLNKANIKSRDLRLEVYAMEINEHGRAR